MVASRRSETGKAHLLSSVLKKLLWKIFS